MLSPDYFDFRWSWYRPILNRGENPTGRCRVDVRRLPVRIPGEDAREYIPYAIHPQLSQTFTLSLQRLQEYSVRYMINGEKISGHQLPQMDALSRSMGMHLRKRYPHLPHTLVHHWCGDEKGAPALYQVWQNMWKQSWKQDQADVAPWVPAVNVLILKLIREAIGKLPGEHAAHNDHVMVCMVGGLYDWALKNFLKEHVDGAVEVTRIATYEAMMIPATPITFLYRQPNVSMLADDRFVAMAYGLEADLIPRLRVLREKVGSKNEAGILALLAREKMGEHFLKRSWVRLSLWELAEKSEQGVWMQWVLDAKKLDQLLAHPEGLPDAISRLLESYRDLPIAAWLLNQKKGGRAAKDAGTPWLQDDRVLMAFRVFEEDVKVEVARRKFEQLWLDQRSSLGGAGKGAESSKLLEAAYDEGKLIYFQPDAEQSLHSGTSLSMKQGCLRIEWSDYLAAMLALHGDNQLFLEKTFLPGVVTLLEDRENIFLDNCSAMGCRIRGSVAELTRAGVALRSQMSSWYRDVAEADGAFHLPAISMCITLVGDWAFASYQRKGKETVAFAFGLSVAQADAGISRDCGVGRLIAYRDDKAGREPLGGVRVEQMDSGTGKSVQVLYNNGFALTASAVGDLTASMHHKASIREFKPNQQDAESLLSGYRYFSSGFELIVITPRGDESSPILLAKVGTPCLAGVDTDLYELLDKDAQPAQLILSEGLKRWG
ncbi:MAG: hypothetical protein GQ467_02045 [Mariprofundaceae bacterium]|nr:hypothetical protein [Mariprofundaceae bacterium]